MTPREERGGVSGKGMRGLVGWREDFFIHSDHGLVEVVAILCLGNGWLAYHIWFLWFFIYWLKATSCQLSYSECDKSFADLIQQFYIVVLLFLGLWIKHVLVPFVRRSLRSGIRTSLACTWQPTISRDYCSGNDSRCVPYVPIWDVKRVPR